MKDGKLLRLLPAVTLLMFGSTWILPMVAQQDGSAANPAAQQQKLRDTTNQQQVDIEQAPEVTTFGGTILRSGDKLVLLDSIGESTYLLDDHGKAKSFEGKNVRVKGTVDQVNRTITVVDLKPDL
jgi:Protein of unknown function (DUF5818)